MTSLESAAPQPTEFAGAPIVPERPDAPLVFVVDDDDDTRASLCALVESAGLQVVPCASAAELFVRYSGRTRGCLVLDLRLPDLSGIQALRHLGQRDGYVPPAVIVTGHGDVPTAVEAIKIGVVDFLEKPFAPQRLLQQVRHAIALDAEARHQSERQAVVRTAVASLTVRERQVLDLLLADRSNKQIAIHLGLSEKTVATHRANLLEKLAATSLLDAARKVRLVLDPSPRRAD